MNSFRTMGGMVARLTVSAALLALAAVAQAAVEKGVAKVVAVQGAAEVSLDGTSWAPLAKGERLGEGALVRTAPGGAADLDLGRNGSLLRVMPGSTVAFSALTYERTSIETIINTQLELRTGRLMGHVQKLSAASKYEVKTPAVVAGIRGTRYDITAEGKVVVAEGSVVVVALGKDGTTLTRVVNASETFSPASGVVTPATEADLGGMGGGDYAVSGITGLPPLQGRFYDDRTAIDRTVLPVDLPIERNSISPTGPVNGGE
jgi:hypothetical protein